MTDVELARTIAEKTGEILIALQRSNLVEGAALGQAGDRLANMFILDALRAQRPQDAILSEESTDDPARLAHQRVWIVDPLDGTREYCERRIDWAVHIGLTIDGGEAVGAVALPGESLIFSSDTAAQPCDHDRPLRMVVSRTRPAAEALAVAEALGAELIPMGSAGAKSMAVVRGDADIYLHTGGQYEWDSCAPVAVAAAAGLHVSRADGSPLAYNQENPYLPDLLICRRAVAERVLGLLATIRQGGS